MISVNLLIYENKNNVEKPSCFGHCYLLEEKSLPDCSSTIIRSFSRSSALILMGADLFGKNNLSLRKS